MPKNVADLQAQNNLLDRTLNDGHAITRLLTSAGYLTLGLYANQVGAGVQKTGLIPEFPKGDADPAQDDSHEVDTSGAILSDYGVTEDGPPVYLVVVVSVNGKNQYVDVGDAYSIMAEGGPETGPIGIAGLRAFFTSIESDASRGQIDRQPSGTTAADGKVMQAIANLEGLNSAIDAVFPTGALNAARAAVKAKRAGG